MAGAEWEHLGNPGAHIEEFRCTGCDRRRGISYYSDQWRKAGEPEPCKNCSEIA